MEGYIMYKVKKKETFIPSSNGKDKLHVIVWEPQGEIRAILQISHGMIELIDRYDEFARYLAAKGFVVAGMIIWDMDSRRQIWMSLDI